MDNEFNEILPFTVEGIEDALDSFANAFIMDLTVELARQSPMRTGRLRMSWRPERITKSGNIITASIVTGENAYYGMYVDLGTSNIVARNFSDIAFKNVSDKYETKIDVISRAIEKVGD